MYGKKINHLLTSYPIAVVIRDGIMRRILSSLLCCKHIYNSCPYKWIHTNCQSTNISV